MCDEIMQIKEDEYSRNRFIERYKPFIAKYASEVSHRYLQYGQDEELSIALLAFDESINRYNGEGYFFSYAKQVMKSRLYDYFQSQAYREMYNCIELDDDQEKYYIGLTSLENYHKELRQEYLKEEIDILKKELSYYKIDIIDLYDSRPKHKMSRNRVHSVVKKIIRNDEIVSIIIDQKKLPIKQITQFCNITVKKIEPYRKYIIGIVIICEGQFELLKEYMPREVIEL